MSNKKKRKEAREGTRGKEIGRDISLELRSRNRVKSRTTNDQDASTALRTQKPRS